MPKTLEARLVVLTTAQLAIVYNDVSERKVSRFSDHSTAVKRTLGALQATGREIVVQNAGDPLQYQLVDAGKAPASGRDGDTRTITVLAESNPKARGSKSEARFAKYRTGMTVGEYIAAVAPLGGGRRKAVRDLTWDAAHDYIRVG